MNNNQGQRGAAGATSIVQEGRTGFAGMRVQSPLAQSPEPPPLARILLILLIPTFLLGGCQLAEDVFGKPWEKVYTLSQAVRREAKHSVSARYYRIDTATASVVFTNQHGDQTKFVLAWPVEWGVVIMANDIRTENGADPVVLREKYIGNF